MKKSKRFAALFAAVLMAITMFTGSISAYAAAGKHDPSVPIQLGSDTYSSLTITGWRSINSTTSMKAQTTANKNAYRIAVTMVPRTVDSKGNLVKAGGKPDRSLDGKNVYPEAGAYQLRFPAADIHHSVLLPEVSPLQECTIHLTHG